MQYSAVPAVPSNSKPEPSLAPRGLRVAEAAKYLGVTVNFVRTAVAKRQLPAMMLGHRLVLDVRDLDRFLDRMKHRCAA